MELRVFEQIRLRKVFKLFFFLLLNTAIMIVTVGFATKQELDIFLYIFIIVHLLIYSMVFSIPKNFENYIKKALLPSLLKNILKEDGEIKWQGEEFETKEKTPKEKIIENLENYIDKQCPNYASVEANLHKYIEYFNEREELEKKETLTQSEELRLQTIEAYIQEDNERAEALAEEKNNIRVRLLKELKDNNSLNQPSEEDLIKIEYLKKENQKYEELKELDTLREKNLAERTEEDNARLDYLEKRYDEYRNSSDRELETLLSDTDRALCLFKLFNRSVSYDDVFYGNYKGTEFIAIEGKEEKIFNGTIIRIPLKNEFNNTLLVLSKKFNVIPLAGVAGLQTNLKAMNLSNLSKHTIWTENSNNIANILEDKFVQYIQNSNNSFSYMFKENFAYLIWSHKKDFYKLGSLFKKVDDKKQYQNFEKDIRSMLYEIEKFANSLQ